LRQSNILRALNAAAACGLRVSRFEIHPDGKLVVWINETEEPERNHLAEWQAERARRNALKQFSEPPALRKPKKPRSAP